MMMMHTKMLSKSHHQTECYRRFQCNSLSSLCHICSGYKKMWKKSHVVQEDTARVCHVKKTKAHLENNLIRNVKGAKKDLYRYRREQSVLRSKRPTGNINSNFWLNTAPPKIQSLCLRSLS